MKHCFILPGYAELFAVTQSQQSNIQKYADEIVELRALLGALEAKNARLKAAGLAIAPHTVQEDSISDSLWCGACRVSMRDDEDFVHADDCPTRVFTEGAE